jgi:hypothetical protein
VENENKLETINGDLKMSNVCVIGVDNGKYGGISIIDGDNVYVHKMPIITKIVNKKNKKVYDINGIKSILKPYSGKKVLFMIETISIRPGEGGISSMTTGKGFGILIGLASAFEFDIVEVAPTKWKNFFQELKTDLFVTMKEELVILKEKSKTIKILEEKELKKENTKQIDKLNRQIKIEAKTAARLLASKLYPNLSDNFQKMNSDGVAESLLIAIFGKKTDNKT